MEETVKTKKGTYRITTEVVPPKLHDKVEIDTPVAFVVVNAETGEEVERVVTTFLQGHTNTDVRRHFEWVKQSVIKKFGDD